MQVLPGLMQRWTWWSQKAGASCPQGVPECVPALKGGTDQRSTHHQELSLWREKGERDQTVTSREAAAAATEVASCNNDLNGKRDPHRFSSQDEVGAHQREQNPQ